MSLIIRLLLGVDEQLIRKPTGHLSNAIRAYKRTSSAQQSTISKLLDASPNIYPSAILNRLQNVDEDRQVLR